jgi:hypothetical protein
MARSIVHSYPLNCILNFAAGYARYLYVIWSEIMNTILMFELIRFHVHNYCLPEQHQLTGYNCKVSPFLFTSLQQQVTVHNFFLLQSLVRCHFALLIAHHL